MKRFGRTTVLRILATLLEPHRGRATVGGLEWCRLADAADRPVRTYPRI